MGAKHLKNARDPLAAENRREKIVNVSQGEEDEGPAALTSKIGPTNPIANARNGRQRGSIAPFRLAEMIGTELTSVPARVRSSQRPRPSSLQGPRSKAAGAGLRTMRARAQAFCQVRRFPSTLRPS